MRRPPGAQNSRNRALTVLANLSPVFQDEQETLVGGWKDNDAHRVQFAAPVALSPADSLTCVSLQPRGRCQSTGMEEGFQCKQL